jgi:hypothetical protein
MLCDTAQVFHQVCQFFVSSCQCLEMMPSWCRQVNWGNTGIPWVNCAVLCVKDNWKGQFWGLRYCLSRLRCLLSFFGQVWRHTVKSLSLTESVNGAWQVSQLHSIAAKCGCNLFLHVTGGHMSKTFTWLKNPYQVEIREGKIHRQEKHIMTETGKTTNSRNII